MHVGIGCAMIRRGCFSVYPVYLVCLVVLVHFGSVRTDSWFGAVRGAGVRVGAMVWSGSF